MMRSTPKRDADSSNSGRSAIGSKSLLTAVIICWLGAVTPLPTHACCTLAPQSTNQKPPQEDIKTQEKQKNSADKKTADTQKKQDPARKLSIGEQRLEDLKKQFNEEKEDRPDTPKLNTKRRMTKPGQPIELSFDDIKFKMEKSEDFLREMVTPDILALHGKIIKIRGYIKPGTAQAGLKKFIFVRDNKECCFGPQAAIFDNIMVSMMKGKTTSFSVLPVTIEGKFYLREYTGPDGKVWSVYRMKNTLRR